MALEQRLERQPPLLPSWALLQSRLQMGAILPGLDTPPIRPVLKLHWLREIGLLHPMSSWDPAPPISQIAHSRPVVRQPVPLCTLLGPCICEQAAALSLQCLHSAHTLWGRFLVVGHWCRPKLQCLLGRSLGSMGPRWTAAGLTVIRVFCGSPWAQLWQQSMVARQNWLAMSP